MKQHPLKKIKYDVYNLKQQYRYRHNSNTLISSTIGFLYIVVFGTGTWTMATTIGHPTKYARTFTSTATTASAIASTSCHITESCACCTKSFATTTTASTFASSGKQKTNQEKQNANENATNRFVNVESCIEIRATNFCWNWLLSSTKTYYDRPRRTDQYEYLNGSHCCSYIGILFIYNFQQWIH